MNLKAVSQFNYTQTLQSFVKGFLYIMTSYYFVEVLFFWPYYGSPSHLILFVALAVQLISIMLAYTIPLEYLKKLFTIYIMIVTLVLYAAVVELGTHNIFTPYVWFLVAAQGIYVLYPWQKMLPWVIYLTTLSVSSRILSYLFVKYDIHITNHLFYMEKPTAVEYPDNYFWAPTTLVFAFVVALYFLYYSHKIQFIRIQVLYDDPPKLDKKQVDMPDNADMQKYKELYDQIEKYFETEQPFVNPDFTAAQLASALNTNIAYISKAINHQRSINFNVFVNHYRIKMVKQMMHDSSHKYTLEYISSVSGFRNQSTFNKAFKSIEGVTPSAYSKTHEVTAQQ
ncbi:hypothetical protein AGMMS49574_14850 [Bacteroidia bacterium]|nr:hypothetical protein AGMMS49574_14850 [Bacteroidia bacterium]GHV06403.1 hypothetical protein FACS189416_6980 [Bacteroidia bacterium]